METPFENGHENVCLVENKQYRNATKWQKVWA